MISDESDVDGLVLRDHVEREDDRAITGLSADLAWQLAGVVISPMVMSVGRDFVLTSKDLREGLTACTGLSEPRTCHHRLVSAAHGVSTTTASN